MELIIEANKETSMLSLLACGSGDWAKTLCVSVLVGAGGVYIWEGRLSHVLGVLGALFASQFLACLPLGKQM